MKWFAVLVSIIGALLPLMNCKATAQTQPEIYLSSSVTPQGDLCLIKVVVENGETPHMTWMGREVYLVPDNRKTDWHGFLTVDLTARPGRYKALVKTAPSGYKKQLEIEVREKDYGVRRLTLPKNMVDLDVETLKRVRRESRIMKSLWEAPPSTPFWSSPFLRPIPGRVIGPFGQRSIINNQPRSPHSGVDLKAPKGTPVKAINNGKVALICDHFFSGRSVVMDHGGGIQSMYFHLEKIMVQQGEMVTKGQVIALVGATGRVTGPHLHWGIRINGARVNPLRLIMLSQQFETSQ